MNYKKFIVLITILMAIQFSIVVLEIEAKEQRPKIVMIYMTDDHLPTANVHFWEATFSSFAKEIELVEASQIDPTTFHHNDVIVLIGEERGVVPLPLQEEIKQFKGKIIAFGHNAEQLQPYAKWGFSGMETIRTLDEQSLPTTLSIVHAVPPSGAEMISVGRTMDGEIPFIVQQGPHAYVASTSIGLAEKLAVSKALYTLLDQEPPAMHQGYIRLEDISPITDPKLVKEAGDYLADRGIPFYMAVTFVHVDSVDGGQVHLAQNKELVQVLRDLQNRGGMVIAHGYTHSYRFDETGEGFEFWDSELNQQITAVQPDEPSFPLKGRPAFPSQEAYDLYMNEIDEIEKKYIDGKHTKSIEQLTDIGLYPVAFEAPHYTMSSNGYRVTSNYFSSLFGQIQLSDDNWEVMNAPLFTSKPAMLSGMTLYPETIGFVDPTLADPLEEMEVAIERLKSVPGSMIGGFYHPYIGMAYLPGMIELMESVDNMEWLDLRKSNQFVQTDQVAITQMADEAIQVSSTIGRTNRLLQQLKDRPLEAALWVVALVVGLFLFAFSIYISGLRVRLKKRLFEEREHIG